MYFTLEINEQLANAMRAVAEAKAEIGIFQKSEAGSIYAPSLDELNEVLSDAINRIANISGCVIAAIVIDESYNRINENK